MCKICTSCKNEMEFIMYSMDKKTKDGYCYRCKKCSCEKNKKYKKKGYIPKIPFTKEEYKLRVQKRMVLYNKEYQKTHKEDKRRNQRKYITSDKGKLAHILKEGRRRAYKLNTSNESIHSESILILLNNQNSMCNICKEKLDNNKHLDHIIPLSKGGPHILDNVQWLCAKCNLKKSNKIIYN